MENKMGGEFIRESRPFRGLSNEKIVFLNLCAMYYKKGGTFCVSNEDILKSQFEIRELKNKIK